MGNKNERSEDRRDRKQARRNKENGLPNPEKTAEVTSSVTKVKDPAPAPVVTTVPTTKAGVSEYNDFFGLYAKSVRENRSFRPLGFIPGPAVILEFREGGEARVFAATSDVAKEIGRAHV